jgi:hypothetical protein
MSRFIIAFVSMGLLAIACNNGGGGGETTDRKNGFEPAKTQEDSLFRDVMKGHDVGMAKIGQLNKNINETKRQLDSLNKLPAGKVNAAYKQSLTDLQTNLNNAHKEMYGWMGAFKVDSASDNKDLRIKYLQGEKEKVTVVKEQIFSALQQADSLLKDKGQ